MCDMELEVDGVTLTVLDNDFATECKRVIRTYSVIISLSPEIRLRTEFIGELPYGQKTYDSVVFAIDHSLQLLTMNTSQNSLITAVIV